MNLEDMDRQAVQAADDARLMEKFISGNEPFIIQCAYSAVHRYLSKSDDEWSVAHLAFLKAVENYSIEKGHFSSFAKLIIQRRLTDYFRSQAKYRMETPVNPSVLDSELEEEDQEDSLEKEVRSTLYKRMDSTGDSLKLEIESAGQLFVSYGFSFFELAKCSPKAEKTKKACAQAVVALIRHPVLLNEMRRSKMLPMKQIEMCVEVPRKILERHRKYIIAAAEIITGDYPCLADYLRFIREELEK